MAKLTAKGVEKAKPGRHADGRGLYLHVRDGGSRAWVLRVQVEGRRRDIGLGSDLSLVEAREQAAELRKVARSGQDPIEARDKDRLQAKATTFEQAAKACHEASKRGWVNKHAAAWLSSMQEHVFPTIGQLAVDRVDAAAIERALQSIWINKPVIARKLRHRVLTTLNYAKGKGWRLEPAPADALRQLLRVASQPRGGNFAAMPFVDVPAFVARLEGESPTIGRLALMFTILTAARSGEVRSALVKHVDADAKLWNRPATLMKSRTAHSVTLNTAAIGVLRRAAELRREAKPDDPLFPGKNGKPLSDMTMPKIMRDAEIPYTVHGFRSAFRDWAAETMTGTPDAVAEAALAHTVSDAVVAAYRRTQFLELRRHLLDAWGSYLTGGSKVAKLAAVANG